MKSNASGNINSLLKSQNTLDLDWLAGLIDGAGCILINKKGSFGLKITVATLDLIMLQPIKAHFGGSIKSRAGSQSVRYRLHNKSGLRNLMQAINGRLHNTVRLNQFKQYCAHFGLVCFSGNKPFHWDSAYVSGLFDSDGTVSLNVKTHGAQQNLSGTPGKIQRLSRALQIQLTISITQKYAENLAFLNHPSAGLLSGIGRISFDRSQNGYYTWYVTSRKDVTKLLHYFKTYPSCSVKAQRLNLIKTYYSLIDAGAHISNNVALQKQWQNFATRWFTPTDLCN